MQTLESYRGGLSVYFSEVSVPSVSSGEATVTVRPLRVRSPAGGWGAMVVVGGKQMAR